MSDTPSSVITKWPKGYNSCPLCAGKKARQNLMCGTCRRHQRRSVEQPEDPLFLYIALTKGQKAIVDAVDYDFLMQWNWFANWCEAGRCFYAVRNILLPNGKKSVISMHRQIMGLDMGDPRTVDHVDPDSTLDNRRSNLRIATMTEQAFNKYMRSDNSTGYKGVRLHKRSGLFMASIKAHGEFHYLGYRKTAESAWRDLYVPAALRYHGEFARI